MNTAVILAAGRGTRLRSVIQDIPKGLMPLGGRPLVQQSIEKLQAAGIKDVIIVTGHCAEQYGDFVASNPGGIRTVHNEKFADSGSMYSLYCARDAIEPPFLLLESDLIFEQRALNALIEDEAEEAILMSGQTGAGDEVYIATNGSNLQSMSKDPAELGGPIAGELVGITKVSDRLFQEMIRVSEVDFRNSLHVDYETDCLVGASKHVPIRCLLVEDLLWAEIDDENHLRRARDTVYPAILASEA